MRSEPPPGCPWLHLLQERPTWASETPPSRHSSRRSSNGSSGKNETAQLQWICTQESGIFANEERRREFFL